jgi:3-oxoacyl-[acyl-carrier protein] reductase
MQRKWLSQKPIKMILQNKNAVIYGAAGSLGSTVARAFAKAGGKVFLSGRNLHNVQKLADEIISAGGQAEASKVDALNEMEIDIYMRQVAGKAKTIDISFDAIDYQVIQNIPLVDMSVDDFVQPITLTMKSHFLTARAAAREMIKQGSGLILTLTATPGGIGYPYTGGFAAACCAVESFSRNLASEVGTYGVRVINIRSGGSPDSRTFVDAIQAQPEVMKEVLHKMKQDTMLKKLPPMADIANLAVFLSSDLANTITGVTIDVTGGTTAALNHRVAMQD